MLGSQWKLEHWYSLPDKQHQFHLFYSSVQPSKYQQTSTAGWLLNFKRKAQKNNEDKEYNCLPVMYSFVNYAQQIFNYKSDSP